MDCAVKMLSAGASPPTNPAITKNPAARAVSWPTLKLAIVDVSR